MLHDAKERGFIEIETAEDLIHFRDVMIDCYYLLDDDADNKLRK